MPLDFTKLIEILPGIIMYILPGAIFLKTFQFVSLRPIDKVKDSSEWLAVILISFLIMLPFSLYDWKSLFPTLNEPEIVRVVNIIIVVSSFFLGLITGMAVKCKWLNENVLAKIFNRTFYDSYMWHDVSDFKNGMFIKLESHDKGYYYKGVLRGQYNYGNDTWFKIQYCEKVSYGQKNDDPDHSDKSRIMTLLKLSDYNIVNIKYPQANNKK